MTDRRRAYINPTTNDILLMEWRSVSLHGSTQEDGWIPALEDLRSWQTGAVEIYKPTEPVFITRPDNKHWPILTRDEEADILALLYEPWISRDHVLALHGEPTSVTVAPRDHVVFTEEQQPQPQPLRQASQPLRQASQPLRQASQPLPRHVIAPLLTHAVATGAVCAITLEPITLTNASITSCGHIFQTAALTEWFRLGATTCPECRSPCVV